MLWQAGGSILTPDGKHAAFDSPAGVKALTLLQTHGQHHSIYLDNGNGNYASLFTSGHIGMLWTRAVGPRRHPRRSVLRRPDPARRPQPPDDLGPRQLGGVQQRLGSAHARGLEFLKWLPRRRIDLKMGADDGRAADSRVGEPKLPGYAAVRRRSTRASRPGSRTWATRRRRGRSTRPSTRRSPRRSARRSRRCSSARPSRSRRSAGRPAGQRRAAAPG